MKFDYKMLARILLAMALGLMVNPVHGQVVTNAIAIANGSFEIPAGAQGTVAGVPAGWTASNNDPYGVYNPGVGVYENVVNDILPSPAQGSQVLWMNAGNYLAQFLTNTLAPNKTYTLSGAIGNRGDGYGLQPGDQDYVNLVAGGTIIAQNANLPHPALGSFLKWTISYTSPATGFPSGQLEIRIGQNGTGEVNYDNISLTVSGAGTASTTTLASSQNPASFGSVVTFTATVSGSGGTPSGTVVFYDGTTSLGSGTLNGSGIASFSASALLVAGSPHSITAVYGGDGNFGGSTSSALSEVITVGASTTAISSSQNPAGAGGVVTFTATVSGSGGTPSGTVVFYDGANNLGSGTLNSSGIANFSTSALSVAGSPHSITAVYGGDSNFGGSTSSTLSQAVINLSASTTTIASSQNPAAAGSAVTFSATVSGSGGTPTGTVVFYDGANNLGSGTLNGSGMA
ncbi:MAG: Ig-like domain repeat protein, partial [Limisphaerales bacterium]